MRLTYTVHSAPVLVRLFNLGRDAEKKSAAAVKETANWAKGAVSAASPIGDTQEYHTSHEVELKGGGGSTSATVGTAKPQAKRLEFDFVGPDIKGRKFNHTSLPHPHYGPVGDQVPGVLRANLRKQFS